MFNFYSPTPVLLTLLNCSSRNFPVSMPPGRTMVLSLYLLLPVLLAVLPAALFREEFRTELEALSRKRFQRLALSL